MNAYKQSLYSGITRVLANLAMVGAVFLAMRQASRPGVWPSEAVFCLYFFGITIPVWLIALWICRKVRKTWPTENLTLVTLPKLGKCLVSWSVGKPSPTILRQS